MDTPEPMMASELIAELQRLVAEHGDHPIWISDARWPPDVEFEPFDAEVPDIGPRIHIHN